jgi:hypothetical protein
MTLRELKKLITGAIKECQVVIDEQPKIILSEADLERLLSWCIMNHLGQGDYKKPEPNDYQVHTQISHYSNSQIKPNRRPDILLITENGMEDASKHKEFEYHGSSFTLELKYLHYNDSLEIVNEDFNKRKELYEKTWLYVVVLIESNDKKVFQAKKKRIIQMKKDVINEHPEYRNKLFCYCLNKQKVNFSIK